MDGKYKWIDFLSTNNTLMISNKSEFIKFKSFLKKVDMLDILRDNTNFSDWQRLSINNGFPRNYIIFEYNNYKGLTFGYTIESSIEWYEKKPFTMNDIELVSEKKSIDLNR